MKKPLAIRIDAEVLAAARECPLRDNRSLTTFIEAVLRQRVTVLAAAPAPAVQRAAVEKDLPRGA